MSLSAIDARAALAGRCGLAGRILVISMGCAGFAGAQQPGVGEPAVSSTEAQDTLSRAKALFREGVGLFEAGEVERALDLFRRSRALYPSAQNTVNAALCLNRLERWDEALEMYEAAVSKHADELDGADTAGARAAMARLRAKVGNLSISYNVPGNVVVDGRPRGTLPLPAPLRLMPGRRVVRVIKDGYATYEATIEVKAASDLAIDARLIPLAASGGLRVEDASGTGASVVVDGAVVGTSPWEGMLAPGIHVVQSRLGDRVSPLARVVLVQGQTTLLRTRSRASGPGLYLKVEPPTADLSVDGVPVGRGAWEGALPAGNYAVSATEQGYFAGQSVVRVPEGAGPAQRVTLRLTADEKHPRWPKRATDHAWIGGFAGGMVGPSLHSGPESTCGAPCDDPPVWGLLGGIRAGYEFSWRVSVEVTAGYATLWTRPVRGTTATYQAVGVPRTVNYRFEDILRWKALLVGAGASYPVSLGDAWQLRVRGTAGIAIAKSGDVVTGTARSSAGEVPLSIDRAGEQVRSTAIFAMPELGVERATGPWRWGASLGLLLVPQSGPDLPHGKVTALPDGCASDPMSAACAPEAALLQGERAYGPFLMLVPSLQGAYSF